MANLIPNSFRGALFSGQHDFQNSGGNTFKLSLYTGSIASVYTVSSTVFSATNEVSSGGGSNYAVKTLTNNGVVSSTVVASVDFANVSYSSATFTAAYAAIYNSDTVDSVANRLVVVLDFGGNKTATNGTFTITFPDPTTASNAIISMS
jgi:hypothetical protein